MSWRWIDSGDLVQLLINLAYYCGYKLVDTYYFESFVNVHTVQGND